LKTIRLALLLSAALHVIYVVATFGIGFIRTLNYTPDIIAEADNVTMLQNEVTIGTTGSPLIYVFTWIGLAINALTKNTCVTRLQMPL